MGSVVGLPSISVPNVSGAFAGGVEFAEVVPAVAPLVAGATEEGVPLPAAPPRTPDA